MKKAKIRRTVCAVLAFAVLIWLIGVVGGLDRAGAKLLPGAAKILGLTIAFAVLTYGAGAWESIT